MDVDRERLGRTFDAVAERYDAVRPGYPRQTMEDLAAVTGPTTGSSVLEIGCGTRKLTVGLAASGATVTAIEPGSSLASRTLADHPNVTVHIGRFEDAPVPERGTTSWSARRRSTGSTRRRGSVDARGCCGRAGGWQ